MVQAQKITLRVIRGGTSYLMTDYARLYQVMGAGLAPLHRIQQRGPLQHGITDRGFRLDARNLRLLFYFTRKDEAFFNNREMLTRIFAPSDNPLTLRFDLANGERRQIEGHARALDLNTDPSRPTYQNFAVDIICPDPTFYDPTDFIITLESSYSGTANQVPMPVPMFVGSSELGASEVISYNGSFREFPYLIRIYGQITDPIVTNNSTGEVLDFTGTTIADGDYYDIDLRYSYKTVKDNNGANKIADLTDASDLATWHLATSDEVIDGINSITVSGSSINSNAKVVIRYYERFLGW